MVIFDDRDYSFGDAGTKPDFGPITDLRAVFELRTGALTTAQRLAREWPDGVAAFFVPTELTNLVGERNGMGGVLVNELPEAEATFFLVNGRWSFPGGKFNLTVGQALVEEPGGAVVAAELMREQAAAFLADGELPDDVERFEHAGQMLLRRPWEMLGMLGKTLMTDLLMMPEVQAVEGGNELGLAEGVTVIGKEPVVVHEQARIYPTVVLDVEEGPIVIAAGAVVRPGAILRGPIYVGSHSTILDHALIKGNTVIGPYCKVAGEIGGTIFQGCANKGHAGHLGDSYVGEWVNFGAGTTNSNLLNTYGEIVMQLRRGAPHERSGLQFLGTLVGDHVKFGINTRIMTGTVVGTGAMIATGLPPAASVEPFSWTTDSKVHLYRWEKFIEVAEAVMDRRGMELSEATRHRLQVLHAKAAGE